MDDDTLKLLKRCVSHSLVCAVRGLHGVNVIHGDLHAGNVLIRPHVWSVVLIDFADSTSSNRERDVEQTHELVRCLCDSIVLESPVQISHMEERLANPKIRNHVTSFAALPSTCARVPFLAAPKSTNCCVVAQFSRSLSFPSFAFVVALAL